MFTSVTRSLSAAIIALGLFATTGAYADDRGGDRRDGWHRDRHDHRHHRGHDGRHDRRDDRRDARHYDRRHDHHYGSRNDYRPRYDRWYEPRRIHSPYARHRCNDRRHYGFAHFHVPVREYRREVYEHYPYRGVYRDRGAAATVILSFPL